ncbi:MAG: DUF2863 family protein [Betaproteobacteria bacterium]
MKRTRNTSRGRMARDAERMVALAMRLNASGSQLEDRFWERELHVLLTRVLRAGNDSAIETALDHLFTTGGMAYEVLVDQSEAMAESQVMTHADADYDVMLVAAPILAWTRYAIPSGALRAADADILRVHLSAHVLAADTRVVLAPYLFSLEQIPHSFAEAFALTAKFGAAALAGGAPRIDLADAQETAPMLADSRFLLACVAVPRGKPIFRWQEHADTLAEHVGRAQCHANWQTQARPNLAPLLPSCGFELLLPDAFYASFHDSDRLIRPYTIKASSAFLEGALKIETSQLRAFVAGVGEEGIDEYRIGFAARGDDAIVHGVAWPLYGREDASAGSGDGVLPIDEIVTLLKETGIADFNVLGGKHFPEYCEDCGAPLFPDANGDFVHAEMPAGDDGATAHFH